MASSPPTVTARALAKRRFDALKREAKARAIAARGWRLGHAVFPRVDPFASLPLVYTAGLVSLRIDQLAALATGGRFTWGEKIVRPPIAERAFRECRLTRATTWATTRPRPVIPCPRCGHLAWRLHAGPLGWSCWKCEPTGCIRTEILLGDYACGLRIGLTGQRMMNRRRFLLQRLHDRHLRKGRTAKDLAMLAIGGSMLAPLPVHQRLGYKRGLGQLGPVWRRLAPELVSVAVDSLLHPDAYRARYARPGW